MAWNKLIVCLLAVAAAATPACYGWGSAGHRIIGYIAASRLRDETRLALWPLLRNDELWEASLWADQIKSDSRYDWAKPLHYVNLKVNLAPNADAFVLERDCPGGECVVGAILRFAEIVRDTRRPPAERAEALRFLLHFVGDVHQPLHAGYARDRGGNSIHLQFFGRDTNLHRAWDSDILEHAMRGGWRAYAQRLDESITDEQISRQRATMDPGAWATESFAITRSHVYRALPRSGQVDEAYCRSSIDIIDERLVAAGIRLAAVLDTLLATSGSVAAGGQATSTPSATGAPGAPGAATDPDGPSDPSGPVAPTRPAAPAATATARDLVRLVEGEPCGGVEGGREILLVSDDPSAERLIRVRLRRTWTDGAREREAFETIVVKPGAAGRREIGCTARRLANGETRTFAWEIVEAEFR